MSDPIYVTPFTRSLPAMNKLARLLEALTAAPLKLPADHLLIFTEASSLTQESRHERATRIRISLFATPPRCIVDPRFETTP